MEGVRVLVGVAAASAVLGVVAACSVPEEKASAVTPPAVSGKAVDDGAHAVGKGIGSKDASADVVIKSVEDGEFWGARTVIEVTNHSEKLSNYSVTLGAYDGSTRVDDEWSYVENVAPGETVIDDGFLWDDDTVNPAMTFRVIEVERTAA